MKTIAARRLPTFAIAFLAALSVLLVGILPGTVTAVHADPPAKRLNFAQRHPTMTGAAAGMATHHMLKKSAAAKKARGQKLSFAERHPTITGAAAAMGVHHVLKKSAAGR